MWASANKSTVAACTHWSRPCGRMAGKESHPPVFSSACALATRLTCGCGRAAVLSSLWAGSRTEPVPAPSVAAWRLSLLCRALGLCYGAACAGSTSSWARARWIGATTCAAHFARPCSWPPKCGHAHPFKRLRRRACIGKDHAHPNYELLRRSWWRAIRSACYCALAVKRACAPRRTKPTQ
jgi:hypothetical protein